MNDADISPRAKAAGFYAISYTIGSGVDGLASGTRVIAYRGTNADNASNFVSDAWNGYGTAPGSPSNGQAYLAAEFYRTVTGTTNADPRDGRRRPHNRKTMAFRSSRLPAYSTASALSPLTTAA
jgi:hypothetical protein